MSINFSNLDLKKLEDFIKEEKFDESIKVKSIKDGIFYKLSYDFKSKAYILNTNPQKKFPSENGEMRSEMIEFMGNFMPKVNPYDYKMN